MTLLEVTPWIDWWFCADESLAICDKLDSAKVKHFFVVGARCQILVVKTASTIW